jgi:hypothetical protein
MRPRPRSEPVSSTCVHAWPRRPRHVVYRSASVMSASARNCDDPTAMQTPGDGQDTPLRPADFVPPGCAARWILHLPLLQRSASGTMRVVK